MTTTTCGRCYPLDRCYCRARAADLPEGSVVATDKTVWMAACDNNEYGPRWDGLLGSMTDDAEIDRLLANGAQVLRVGNGKED